MSDWTGALCAQTDPELWFPKKGGDNRGAKAMCRLLCPCQAACLKYALDNGIRDGIWGGHSPNERKRMRKAAPRNTAPLGDIA